jgi:hypothetical protein
MPSQLENCIGFLQESSDTGSAYFSFTRDDAGEHRVIKANKAGLRLYAMELLKKSLVLENHPERGDVLLFPDIPSIADDAGCNFIWGVQPMTPAGEALKPEDAINAASPQTVMAIKPNAISGWLPSLIILSGGLIIVTIAAIKWFH